jgi:hypothetical protein
MCVYQSTFSRAPPTAARWTYYYRTKLDAYNEDSHYGNVYLTHEQNEVENTILYATLKEILWS